MGEKNALQIIMCEARNYGWGKNPDGTLLARTKYTCAVSLPACSTSPTCSTAYMFAVQHICLQYNSYVCSTAHMFAVHHLPAVQHICLQYITCLQYSTYVCSTSPGCSTAHMFAVQPAASGRRPLLLPPVRGEGQQTSQLP